MTRLLMVSCLWAATLAAQQPPNGAAADSVSVRRLLDSARVLGLPADPLRGVIDEGRQRGVSSARVLTALRDNFSALQRAKHALGAHATDDEVVAGAGVLLSGADEHTIAAIRGAKPDGNITVPLVVLADLIVRGVPAQRAEDALVTLTRVGASDAALHDFRSGVQHDLDAGQGAESSLLKRTRETVSRFQPGQRKPPPDSPEHEPASPMVSRALAPQPLLALGGAVGEIRASMTPLAGIPVLRLQGSADGAFAPSMVSMSVGAEGILAVGSQSSAHGAAFGLGAAAATQTQLRAPFAYGALWLGGTNGGVRFEARSARLARSDAAVFTNPPAAPLTFVRGASTAALSSSDTGATIFPPANSNPPATDSGGGAAPHNVNAPEAVSDLRIAMNREVGKFTFEGATGLRMLNLRPFDTWGSLSIAAWIQPTVAIVGSVAMRRAVHGLTRDGAPNAALGFRWQPANPFARFLKPPAPELAGAVAEGAIESGAAGAEFVLVAAGAQLVEVSGDFTHWSPVEMTRADATHWRIALPPGSAIVRLKVRLDGGAWIVPGGVPRVRDAFGEDVGTLVVDVASTP